MSDTSDRRSGLVVPVPEAEPLVGTWRMAHDPSAPNGAPAHITLLFPFRPADLVDDTLEELGALFATVPRQRYRLAHIGVFPRVTWLSPEPASVFRDLTERLVERFPDCPPYGGAYDRIIPHLTAIDHSHRADGPTSAHEAFVVEVDPALPIEAELAEVILLVEDDAGRWTTHATFPLGGAVAT